MVQPLSVGHGNFAKVQQRCDNYGLREFDRRKMKLSLIQIAAQAELVARMVRVGAHFLTQIGHTWVRPVMVKLPGKL